MQLFPVLQSFIALQFAGAIALGCSGEPRSSESVPLPADLAASVPLAVSSGTSAEEASPLARSDTPAPMFPDAGAASEAVSNASVHPRLAGLDPERVLVATAKRTPIYSAPTSRATELGYLRSGALVERSPEAKSGPGCRKGFYEIESDGYVCVGEAASLDPNHPLVAAHRTRPDREQPLPYIYGRSKLLPPPLYSRVPLLREQQTAERGLITQLARNSERVWAAHPLRDVPAFLAGGAQSLYSNGKRQSPLRLVRSRAARDSSFALLELFESAGRKYGLTTDFSVVPLDRLEPVTPSSFHGVPITEEQTLPLVFVRASHAQLYSGEPTRGLRRQRAIRYREAFSLSGQTRRVSGQKYLQTSDGTWLKDSARLVHVKPLRRAPGWATPGRSWLDVSIRSQTLVAYEGTTPVYATLVSTGKDGLKDPETSSATVRGQFLVHTKHVSITMSSDEPGDAYDLRDVPYVQYFSGGYAFHSAYWHDSFGAPKSHGCINLSPTDARWLFNWTDPYVPERWHGAMSLLNGTLVDVHP